MKSSVLFLLFSVVGERTAYRAVAQGHRLLQALTRFRDRAAISQFPLTCPSSPRQTHPLYPQTTGDLDFMPSRTVFLGRPGFIAGRFRVGNWGLCIAEIRSFSNRQCSLKIFKICVHINFFCAIFYQNSSGFGMTCMKYV